MLVTETERISGTNAGVLESRYAIDPAGEPTAVPPISPIRFSVKGTHVAGSLFESREKLLVPSHSSRGRSRELPL